MSLGSVAMDTSPRRGIPALPLLTAVNFFNYMDRQVVYSMTPHLAEAFNLSKFRVGMLGAVNLAVFAIASLVSGPIADRLGPRRVIFTGVLLWSIATIGSALSTSFPMLLFFRALVGVGEGAYGPSANALLCANAPPHQRGRALGIYNAGMAFGASTGLFCGAVLAPHIGWRGVFWLAGTPSMVLALMSAFVAAPKRLELPHVERARAYLLNPTFLIYLAGGILVTFGASGLLFWSRELIIDERGFSVIGGSIMMLSIGLGCGIGGVLLGGYVGDRHGRRRKGGHAFVMGVSLLIAVPLSAGCLLITNKPIFGILTAATVFMLSVYNGPAAVVVDQLAPARYAATLQAVFLFFSHVLGNAPAPPVIGAIAEHATMGHSMLVTTATFLLSGALFVYTGHRQLREPSFHAEEHETAAVQADGLGARQAHS